MNSESKYGIRQTAAEQTGREVIHSWAEYGRTATSDIPLEQFPNETLSKIARAVGEASENGIKGWGNVLSAAFTNAPEGIRNAFIECCQEVAFPPSPEHCGPAVAKLRAFHFEKRTREILDAAHRANESGDPIDGHLAELEKLKSDTKTANLASLLATRAFNFDTPPEKPVPIFTLCDMPISTPGNISNIQGQVKSGKSAAEESMIAAAMNGKRQGPDTLGFSAENPKGLALIHFDTEQSRYDHDALIRRACRRAQVEKPPAWFSSYSVADLDIGERRRALRHVMHEAREIHDGIFAVMIDGIGDLCADPNDSEEAFDLVHELHALAITHACGIFTVLHENPGSETGKTRGHLGSQLERKAETNLRLAKDKDGITTMWADRARHCYLPKEQGPCFSWNDAAAMHTSCGTAGEIKSTANREKMQSEADTVFSGEESLRHTDLLAAIGKAFDLKEGASKNRVKKWAAEGIVHKDSAGNYHLSNP